MTLLNGLGLLGLLSIIVLIIIYIIKPNYQQKFISSTFVWKLSLKYRKKRIPTSKLRNILLILCQVLILTTCALILSKPAQVFNQPVQESEVILIVDSSASMRAETEKITRFERAVSKAVERSDEIFSKNGLVSVILADSEAGFLTNGAGFSAQRLKATQKENLRSAFNALIETETDGDISCSYGYSDVDGAIALCEEILKDNPSAQIYLYTDTAYSYVPKQIHWENVATENEWNVAILDAYADYEENYYSFYVDVAAYGRDMSVDVKIEVHGANAQTKDGGTTLAFSKTVTLSGEETRRVYFLDEALFSSVEFDSEDAYIIGEGGQDERVLSYQDVYVYIEEADSFAQDNSMYIYGGQKEIVEIQYASSLPNSFFTGILSTLKTAYKDMWDIHITEIKKGNEKDAKTTGFDFYIFEHTMPETMPTDGIVLLVNPGTAPADSGFTIVEKDRSFGKQSESLTQESSHAILKNITADNITVSQYMVGEYDPSYQVLLSCDTTPVLLLQDEGEKKVVVMSFSLNYSNLPILIEYPLLMNNIFKYYFPSTISNNVFEVNEQISLNARGDELTVSYGSEAKENGVKFSEFPATFDVLTPGTYTLTQTTDFGKEVQESIYVKIPASESNINDVKEALAEPYVEKKQVKLYDDLLLYFAAALVALLFIEWWLQSRENM